MGHEAATSDLPPNTSDRDTMTPPKLAPARLTTRDQKLLSVTVTVVTLAVLSAGLIVSWPTHYEYWIKLVVFVSAIALASTFVYRVSSMDQVFAFGLTASLLAVFAPHPRPIFAVTIWTIGVLIGLTVMHRSVVVAAQATLGVWFSAIALVTVSRVVNASIDPTQYSDGSVLRFMIDLHIPEIVLGLLAFYVVFVCISTVRALILTRFTLKEVVLRVSWGRVSIMLIAEVIIASAFVISSGFLNMAVFQATSPYGNISLIIVASATIFGFASKRQARTSLLRVHSLVNATEQLPWPASSPAHVQAAEFAQRALPVYHVMTYQQDQPTLRDHILSVPIEEDGGPYTLIAVRQAGQPPFRVEDQRVLDAIAQIANETIRGRKEVHRLRRLAHTDRLTGLLNYRAFQVALDDLSQWHNADHLVALIFIDIDNFKTINDKYGHEVGNSVLKVIAQRLQSVVASPGLVSRVGGDEFAILLQRFESRSEVEVLQQRLKERVNLPIELDGAVIPVSISQGLAFSTPGQQDLSPLVELADRRMYESRGNRTETAVNASYSDLLANNGPGVVLALREGILQRRLQLVYQPIIDLHTQEVISVEALMRYNDPMHGSVPAALVLSEAERLGLFPALSEQLLELSIQALERIKERRTDLRRLHFNVSLEQLIDENFTRLVRELTARQPDIELVLEINERSLRNSTAKTINLVEGFVRENRVGLAIDDIGNTYTGLASLRDFPFTVWKVDVSVVREFQHERSGALVRGLIGVANELQVDLIFEGIENEAQHEWLVGLGAQFGQGFLYGHPVSVDELLLRFETGGMAARL